MPNKSKAAKSTTPKANKAAKPAKIPEQDYEIRNPSWAPNSWSIYLPNKRVWSSQTKTPEELVEIYGGVPLNFKELSSKGYFADGLPKKRSAKVKDLDGVESIEKESATVLKDIVPL